MGLKKRLWMADFENCTMSYVSDLGELGLALAVRCAVQEGGGVNGG